MGIKHDIVRCVQNLWDILILDRKQRYMLDYVMSELRSELMDWELIETLLSTCDDPHLTLSEKTYMKLQISIIHNNIFNRNFNFKPSPLEYLITWDCISEPTLELCDRNIIAINGCISFMECKGDVVVKRFFNGEA